MISAGSLFAIVALWALGGLVFGIGYFAVLRETIALYGAGQGRFVAALLTIGRFAAAILFLGAAVRFGSLPLLAAFVGFLGARGLALRAVRGNA